MDVTTTLPPMPLLSMSTNEIISHCKNLKDCKDGRKTLFIASYPKSGTTWLQAIIYNLLSDGNQNFSHISEFSPFFEITNTWDLENSQIEGKIKEKYEINHQNLGWRVFNTHLRWEMMPKEENMKYIYIVRNGKDVVLSFFQHLSNQDDADCFQGNLLDFIKEWSDGKIPFGSWLHHLQSWIQAYLHQEDIITSTTTGTTSTSDNNNNNYTGNNNTGSSDNSNNKPILLLRYEDLIHNPHNCILKIISHLNLSVTSQRAEELLQYISFNYMKEHQYQYMPISVPWKDGYSFLRKGKVGDSGNHFLSEHEAVYTAMIESAFPSEQGGPPQWLLDLDIL